MKKTLLFLGALAILCGIHVETTHATATLFSQQVGTNPVAGSVLQTNGTTSTWVATSSLGISGGGGSTTTINNFSGSNFTIQGDNATVTSTVTNGSTTFSIIPGSYIGGSGTSTYIGVFNASHTLIGYASGTYNSSTDLWTLSNLTVTNTAIFNGTTTVPSIANPYDASTNAISHSDAVRLVNLQMGTVPMGSITGGTYSFDTNGTGAEAVVQATGGTISNILTWASVGSGYAVGDLVTPQAGNYDALLRITAVNGSGQPTAGTVIYGGTGYGTGGTFVESGANAAQFSFLLSGTLTSNATFIMPIGTYLNAGSNQWIWANNTTGAFSTTVCQGNSSDVCGAGRTVVVPQGTNNNRSLFIQTDGELNVDLVSPADARDLLSYATALVDSLNGIAGAVNIAGGTGISVASSSQTITVTNTGVTSLTGAGCISFSNSTGTLTTTNTCITTSTFNSTGTAYNFPYWSSGGNSLSPTSTITVSGAGSTSTQVSNNLSVGTTTTSSATLYVNGSSTVSGNAIFQATTTILANSMYGTSTQVANVNENHNYGGTTTTILLGASGIPFCFEGYDGTNSTTLEYIYTSNYVLVATTTKPAFCL